MTAVRNEDQFLLRKLLVEGILDGLRRYAVGPLFHLGAILEVKGNLKLPKCFCCCHSPIISLLLVRLFLSAFVDEDPV
jgi:hypothetical protein